MENENNRDFQVEVWYVREYLFDNLDPPSTFGEWEKVIRCKKKLEECEQLLNSRCQETQNERIHCQLKPESKNIECQVFSFPLVSLGMICSLEKAASRHY